MAGLALVSAVSADGHADLDRSKASTRATTALQSLVIQQLVTQSFSENGSRLQQRNVENDESAIVPPLLLVRVLFRRSDTVADVLTAQGRGLMALTKLIGHCALLEYQVGRRIGIISVGLCGMYFVVFSAGHRWLRRAKQPWDDASAQTIRALREYLMAVLPVQLYAWETKLRTRVLEARHHAALARARRLIIQIAIVSASWGAKWLCVGVILAVLVQLNIELSAFIVFAVILIMHKNLRDVWGDLTPIWRSREAATALERFFSPSLDNCATGSLGSTSTTRTIAHLSRPRQPLLDAASLSFNTGELVLVHGMAGSGKSLLLRSLVHQHKSSLESPPGLVVAYCEQQPWLQHASIRDNIVFGELFDEAKYRCVLEACALLPDLVRLPAGDQTMIHSRGTNLSGGQRARVALARACYADAELYVLDGTLDSVDPVVRHEVFAKCLCHLLCHKTVVLVTHDPELVSSANVDLAVLVQDSSVRATRTRRVTSTNSLLWLARCVIHDSNPGSDVVVYCVWSIGSSTLLFLVIKATGVVATTFLDALLRQLVVAITEAPVEFFEDLDVDVLVSNLWIHLKGADWSWHKIMASLASGASVACAMVLLWAWASGPLVLLLLLPVAMEWSYLTQDSMNFDMYASNAHLLGLMEHWFKEMSAGLVVVRAFGPNCQDRLVTQFESVLDLLGAQSLVMRVHDCYILLRFAFLRVMLLCIFAGLVKECDGSTARGLALVCAVYLPTELLSMSACVFRLKALMLQTHRLRDVANEAVSARQRLIVPRITTPASWPTSGAVEFDHQPSYVLRNVSFTISSGEKIGVVGRTGSGKSSLTMALFRIHEITRGRVLVDGIDVRELSLRDLRSRLRVIPQAPVFYRCSVRTYLDPYDDFEDEQLWRVLRNSGLASTLVPSLTVQLADDGANWSAGERQLLSLARALLQPSPVLVLDEAFAALDQARDDRVLELIDHAFERSTVFLITHRMDQILSFDRVLVMHDEEVAQFDRVEELLMNSDSKFFKLLETSPLTK
ncbi:TPA: hypothetical protein N0F65_005281 [Lagenidium giganteum]|uniref:ABC transporter domain-containing protein n=1 Tax=Lagenidium giganteum TaxID=4803 RepID=A0AAV2Z197_9STRA|nr:TPA: hypothetical protein N0F65_005281 [Lagenidium giganteum]